MSVSEDLLAMAARLVVDEGLEYGPAKRRAAQSVGRGGGRKPELPDNEVLEAAIREHIALFHADTQASELAALRDVAALWMERMAAFRPHLAGAVWRGTATRLSAVHLQLYCDDTKSAEITLLGKNIDYAVGATVGPRGAAVDVLRVDQACAALGDSVPVLMTILDHDDLRGELKPDRSGLTERGDLAALRALMAAPAPAA